MKKAIRKKNNTSILICLRVKLAEKENMCPGTAVQVHNSTYCCSMHSSTVRLEIPWTQQYPAILHTLLGPVRQRRPIRPIASMPPCARRRCCRMSLGMLPLISSTFTTFLHADRVSRGLRAFLFGVITSKARRFWRKVEMPIRREQRVNQNQVFRILPCRTQTTNLHLRRIERQTRR